MKLTIGKALILLLLLTAARLVRAEGAGDRLRESAGAAALLATEAEIARDIALRALENAFAARHGSEATLTAALQSGKESQVAESRMVLEQRDREIEEAVRLVAEVRKCALTSLAAAEAVKAEAKQAQDLKQEKEVEAAGRRMEKLMAEAQRSLRSANAMVESLKKQWLIPTNLLPPAPEPAPASRWRLFGR